jgi:hypothetical protein
MLMCDVASGKRKTCVDSYKPMKALVSKGLLKAEEGQFAMRLSLTEEGSRLMSEEDE